MLARIGGPYDPELGIYSAAGGYRPGELFANPLSVCFVDQIQKVLIASVKSFPRESEKSDASAHPTTSNRQASPSPRSPFPRNSERDVSDLARC